MLFQLSHDIGDKKLLLSAPGSDVNILNNDIPEAVQDSTGSSFSSEDTTPPALQIVHNKDISREISEHVEECCRIAKYVHNALELGDLLHPHNTETKLARVMCMGVLVNLTIQPKKIIFLKSKAISQLGRFDLSTSSNNDVAK